MQTGNTFDLRAVEKVFCFTFISLRLLLLARYFGQYLGYDVRGYLAVVSAISWKHPFLPLHSLYYAVHPPLGFLLTHTLALFGLSPLLSAQLLSFLASLGAFFFMRQTLKSIDLLNSVAAVVFLYVGASIPLQIYLSVVVSLDVFVLCSMSMALFFSVQLFWIKQTALRSLFHGTALVFVLALASLFKLSGLLLLAMPFLVFIFSDDTHKWKRVPIVIITSVLPLFTGVLYLYYRNYRVEHTLFFSTAGLFIWVDSFRRAVEWRDAHPLLFVLSYVLPIKDGVPRLIPTWSSFWFMYDRVCLSMFTAVVGVLYASFAPILCMCGLIAAYTQHTRRDPWHRFGAVILACTAIQICGLCCYMWATPLFGYLANKGIYIASASWGIAYLLAASVCVVLPFLRGKRLTVRETENLALLCTAVFMLINHLMPDIAGQADASF